MTHKYEILEREKIKEKHLAELIKLETSLFPAHYAANLEKVKNWHRTNPDVFIILLCDGHVIGYCDLLPVSTPDFEKIVAGEGSDLEILTKGPIGYKRVGTYRTYLSCIAVSKKHQNTAAILVLKRALFEKIARLRHEGFIITRVAGEAISSDGEKFASAVGAERLGKNRDGNAIFQLEIKI